MNIELARNFIERIEQLSTGQLAMLRRGCGARDSVEGRCPWLLGLIYSCACGNYEPTAFLVASLLAQYKTVDIRAGRHRADGNFGETWRRAIEKKSSESIKRRFHIILDAEYDPRTGEGDLPYRLRQMVRYAASKDVGINWPQLLIDLRFWNQVGKRVQKEWARSFFSNQHAENA